MLKLSPGILAAALFSLIAAKQVIGLPTKVGHWPRAEPSVNLSNVRMAKYGAGAKFITLDQQGVDRAYVRILAPEAMPIIVPKGGKPEEPGVGLMDIELEKDGRVKPESTFLLKLKWEPTGAGGKYEPTQIVHCALTESVPGRGAVLEPNGYGARAVFGVDDDSRYLKPCGDQNGITIVCGIDGDTKNPKADCRPRTS